MPNSNLSQSLYLLACSVLSLLVVDESTKSPACFDCTIRSMSCILQVQVRFLKACEHLCTAFEDMYRLSMGILRNLSIVKKSLLLTLLDSCATEKVKAVLNIFGNASGLSGTQVL